MTIGIGSAVKLVSGGPVMTVQRETPVRGVVVRSWFDESNALKTGEFNVASLVTVDPLKSSGEAPPNQNP